MDGITNVDAQIDIIDTYLAHAAASLWLHIAPTEMQALYTDALMMPGGELEARSATRRLAANELNI